MSIGTNINAARTAFRMTREQLAERVSVPLRTISAWEGGECLPGIKDLPELAAALRVSVDALLDGNFEERELLSPNFDSDRMYDHVREKATELGLRQVLAALPFMRAKHEGQFRRGMVDVAPYYVHPLTLACHALAMGITDDDVLAALLLHDVIEDTDTSPDELPVNDRVRKTVCLVSYNTYYSGSESGHVDKQRIKPAYYGHIAEEPLAALVKCVDRCNNISCMADGFTRCRMKEYVAETEKYIVPLLDVIEAVPEWNNAAWLLRYQMRVLLEAFKRLL